MTLLVTYSSFTFTEDFSILSLQRGDIGLFPRPFFIVFDTSEYKRNKISKMRKMYSEYKLKDKLVLS